MFPHVVNVNTAAGLSLVYEIALSAKIRKLIEPSSRLFLRYASNTLVKYIGQHGLYLCLKSNILPFFVGVMKTVPRKCHADNPTSYTSRL